MSVEYYEEASSTRYSWLEKKVAIALRRAVSQIKDPELKERIENSLEDLTPHVAFFLAEGTPLGSLVKELERRHQENLTLKRLHEGSVTINGRYRRHIENLSSVVRDVAGHRKNPSACSALTKLAKEARHILSASPDALEPEDSHER